MINTTSWELFISLVPDVHCLDLPHARDHTDMSQAMPYFTTTKVLENGTVHHSVCVCVCTCIWGGCVCACVQMPDMILTVVSHEHHPSYFFPLCVYGVCICTHVSLHVWAHMCAWVGTCACGGPKLTLDVLPSSPTTLIIEAGSLIEPRAC